MWIAHSTWQYEGWDKNSGWEIGKILKALWTLLNECPARREKFKTEKDVYLATIIQQEFVLLCYLSYIRVVVIINIYGPATYNASSDQRRVVCAKRSISSGHFLLTRQVFYVGMVILK